MKGNFFTGVLIIVLVFIGGCANPFFPERRERQPDEVIPDDLIPITNAAIKITAPATGETPSSAVTVTSEPANFTASGVTWMSGGSVFEGAVFQPSTVYTAVVTLTANTNYTFTGLLTATIDGGDAEIETNNGNTVTLSFTFDATLAAAVTGITVKTQPDKLTYLHGETLDLAGLEVTLALNDGSSLDYAYNNYDAWSHRGIVTDPTSGTLLSHSAHNGSVITVSYSGHTAATDALQVAPPVITTEHPAPTTSVIFGSISGSLSVTASVTEGAALGYQWYRNTTASNIGGTLIT